MASMRYLYTCIKEPKQSHHLPYNKCLCRTVDLEKSFTLHLIISSEYKDKESCDYEKAGTGTGTDSG